MAARDPTTNKRTPTIGPTIGRVWEPDRLGASSVGKERQRKRERERERERVRETKSKYLLTI